MGGCRARDHRGACKHSSRRRLSGLRKQNTSAQSRKRPTPACRSPRVWTPMTTEAPAATASGEAPPLWTDNGPVFPAAPSRGQDLTCPVSFLGRRPSGARELRPHALSTFHRAKSNAVPSGRLWSNRHIWEDMGLTPKPVGKGPADPHPHTRLRPAAVARRQQHTRGLRRRLQHAARTSRKPTHVFCPTPASREHSSSSLTGLHITKHSSQVALVPRSDWWALKAATPVRGRSVERPKFNVLAESARGLGHARTARLQGKDQQLQCLLGKARATQQASDSDRSSLTSGTPEQPCTEGRRQAPGGPAARAGAASRPSGPNT